MKNLTRQLGYVSNPTHDFKLNITSFPPAVNSNYLDMWSEFIFMNSVQELYNRHKDPKIAISLVGLAFVNFLMSKRLPNVFNKLSIDPARITFDETKREVLEPVARLRSWLDAKQFSQYFLISNRHIKTYYFDNRLLNLKIPSVFEFNIELVSRQPIDKVWSIFPEGYWPKKPNKLNVNFKAFTERDSGMSDFGEYKAALLTGDLLAIRMKIPVSEVLLGNVSKASIERKLNLAIKGKL